MRIPGCAWQLFKYKIYFPNFLAMYWGWSLYVTDLFIVTSKYFGVFFFSDGRVVLLDFTSRGLDKKKKNWNKMAAVAMFWFGRLNSNIIYFWLFWTVLWLWLIVLWYFLACSRILNESYIIRYTYYIKLQISNFIGLSTYLR